MSAFKWFEFSPGVSIWDQMTELHAAHVKTGIAYTSAFRQFLQEDMDRIALLRPAIRSNTHVQSMALQVVRSLKPEEAAQLLPELLYACCWGPVEVQSARNMVLSLPRDVVMDKIEEAAEPLLEDATEEEYRRLLELYTQIDRGLVQRLAERASRNRDAGIREAGTDYLTSECSVPQ